MEGVGGWEGCRWRMWEGGRDAGGGCGRVGGVQVEDAGGWEGCRWRMREGGRDAGGRCGRVGGMQMEGVGEGACGGCGRKGGWEGVHVIMEKCLCVIHLPHTALAQGRPGGSSG